MTLVELQKRLRMLELLCEINTHFLRKIFEAIRRDICTDLCNKVCEHGTDKTVTARYGTYETVAARFLPWLAGESR